MKNTIKAFIILLSFLRAVLFPYDIVNGMIVMILVCVGLNLIWWSYRGLRYENVRG